MQAVGSGIRTGWLLLGITLILIIVCELGLRLALTTRDRLMDRQPPTEGEYENRLVQADAYRDAAWVHEYFKERNKARRSVWSPYVYWQGAPHRSRYINTNQNGLRATWNPPTRDGANDPPPVRVFTFGGSTMWGWGARDDYTIASHLSKLLHAKGYRAEVTNHGQFGYVSTQEAIALLRCIQRGDVPDIVLFYDGINDVFSAHQNGAAGIPMNEVVRRAEFRLSLSWRPKQLARIYGRGFLIKNLWGFHRLVTGLQHRIRPQASPHTGSQVPVLSDEVVRQAVRVYQTNLTLVESLGRGYGFDPLFYWQPIIFSKRHRSPWEEILAGFAFSTKQAYDTIYRRVRQSESLNSHPRFRNISALFDDSGEPYYVDQFHHLSEAGNRRVAAAIADDVIELIEQRRAAAKEKRML
ncbi:SGNH/GDSL hydrolase family protein [Candidatus Thiosymbion oneisti]|uniref:SGNH/GDSL hydrolase family protein n=1 Tax=Candidatus Thiosymbion oneisti TaxID=589554 RepID=UPI00105CCCB9|nr:SGNH/GDSL hydrolase family protein [Candidatus Thiosymbion oneisti]